MKNLGFILLCVMGTIAMTTSNGSDHGTEQGVTAEAREEAVAPNTLADSVVKPIIATTGAHPIFNCHKVPRNLLVGTDVSLEKDGEGNLIVVKTNRKNGHTSSETFKVKKVKPRGNRNRNKYISVDDTVAKTVVLNVIPTTSPSPKAESSLVIKTKKLVNNQTKISTEVIQLSCSEVLF